MNRSVQLAPETRAIFVVPAVVALVAALAWGVIGPHEARAVAALTTSWLFFAGAAAGALAMSAMLELVGATWSQPLHAVAARLSRYLPVASGVLVVLAVLVPETRGLDRGAAVAFFAREVGASFVLFAFGRFTLRGEPGRARPGWVLVAYCLVFAVVGSVWAFDFLVVPSPGLSNTLAGPHLFVGAFMSGLGLAVIGALRAGTLDARERRDTATLVVSLAIFWAYLFWSQLLTFRYSNLPDEADYLARRVADGWSVVSLLVVVMTFAVPFALLLGGRGKRSARVLTVAAASQLIGLWLERQLMVVPSLAGVSTSPFDLPGALTQLAMAAVFVAWTWPWAGPTPLGLGSSPLAHPGVGVAGQG